MRRRSVGGAAAALVLLLGSAAGATLPAAARPLDVEAGAPSDRPGNLGAAERAYRAGDFLEAQARYRAALAEPGAPEGPLLYNLGNVAHRLGDHGEAVLHYRRALLRMPRDRELRFNLRLTERRLGVESSGARGPAALVLALADSLTAGELLLLASTLQSAGLVSLVLLRRRPFARLVPAVAAVFALALTARLVQREWFPAARGVVLAPELPLSSEPRPDIPPIAHLRAGELVRIRSSTPDWLHLSTPRARGWADRRGVGLVD